LSVDVTTTGAVLGFSHMQLLATDAWRAGRSPQTLVRLDCKPPDWESKNRSVETK